MKKEGLIFALAIFMIIFSVYLAYASPYEFTSLQSPNWCRGQWVKCVNAFGWDGRFATAKIRHVGTWRQFNFSLPDDVPIQKVELIEVLPANKRSYIEARVSDDGGFRASH
jgi:hypothetical protein